jgi:hypothetical protein
MLKIFSQGGENNLAFFTRIVVFKTKILNTLILKENAFILPKIG